MIEYPKAVGAVSHALSVISEHAPEVGRPFHCFWFIDNEDFALKVEQKRFLGFVCA